MGVTMLEYSDDHKTGFPATLAYLTPAYLKSIPTCASVGSVTYAYAGSRQAYTLVCAGRNHVGSGIEASDYPQYTSVTGLIERP